MRKFLVLTFIVAALGLTACHNPEKKNDKEIDSLNKVAADSLLNAALADSVNVDSVQKDSLAIDSTKK